MSKIIVQVDAETKNTLLGSSTFLDAKRIKKFNRSLVLAVLQAEQRKLYNTGPRSRSIGADAVGI